MNPDHTPPPPVMVPSVAMQANCGTGEPAPLAAQFVWTVRIFEKAENTDEN